MKPVDVMHCSAVFSGDRRYRYSLARIWDVRLEQVCWVMLNPSRAGEVDDDPTIRRCISFSRRWGFGGMVVVNRYALVATSPIALIRSADPVGWLNEQIISAATMGRRVICAWGNGPATLKAEGIDIMGILQARAPLWCLGVTKAGNPAHPLYVPAAKRPLRFHGGKV